MRKVWLGSMVVAALFVTSPAAAQMVNPSIPQLERRDVAGFLSRENHEHRTEGDEFNPWFRAWAAAGTVGHYWTDHHKLEVGWTTARRDRQFTRYFFSVAPVPPFLGVDTSIDHSVRSNTLSVMHVYQFFRNSGFHPFVGAGGAIDFHRWQTITEETRYHRPGGPVGIYQLVSHTVTHSPIVTRVAVRAVGMAGLKAYFNERLFFRADVTAGVTRRSNSFAWRVGMGWDF